MKKVTLVKDFMIADFWFLCPSLWAETPGRQIRVQVSTLHLPAV